MKNYYEVLQVTRTADQEIIKAAYKKLAEKYHPDHNHSSDATARFQEIQEAFEVLGNFEKRAEYDRSYWEYKKGNPRGSTPESPQPIDQHPNQSPKDGIASKDKNPFLAALLSFLLFGGGGQIYIGQVAKGVALIVLTIFLEIFVIGFIILIIGTIDAYVMADKLQKGETIGQWQFFWN